jgi:hypothetical protein
MTRIYRNVAFARRMTITTVVIVVVIVFGFWELWAALNPGPGGAGYGFLFAALFIFGGLYGLRQMQTDFADTVVSVDADEKGGAARITVWRPFLPKRLAGPLDQLRNWRYEVKTPRPSMRVPMILADHPGHPRPLRFELGKGIEIGSRFRALAPDAFAAFEQSGQGAPG